MLGCSFGSQTAAVLAFGGDKDLVILIQHYLMEVLGLQVEI
jgi:hypothetical protein